jgi:hypothetical protein
VEDMFDPLYIDVMIAEEIARNVEKKVMTSKEFEPRFEVAKFAIDMESVLKDNDFKGNWMLWSAEFLSHKLTEEFCELQTVMVKMLKEQNIGKGEAVNLRKECADLANICMFISDKSYGWQK